MCLVLLIAKYVCTFNLLKNILTSWMWCLPFNISKANILIAINTCYSPFIPNLESYSLYFFLTETLYSSLIFLNTHSLSTQSAKLCDFSPIEDKQHKKLSENIIYLFSLRMSGEFSQRQ